MPIRFNDAAGAGAGFSSSYGAKATRSDHSVRSANCCRATRRRRTTKRDSAKPTDKALMDKAATTLTDEESRRFAADLLWLRALFVSRSASATWPKNALMTSKNAARQTGQRSAEDLRGNWRAQWRPSKSR